MKILPSMLLLLLALSATGQPIYTLPLAPASIPTNYIFVVENPAVRTYKATINALYNNIRSNLLASGVGTNISYTTNFFSISSNTVAAGWNITIATNVTASNVTFTVGTKSNLSFYANGSEFVIGSWGGVFGISNASTARMSFYNNDSADDGWITPGFLTANQLKLIDLGGLGDIVGIGADGTLQRTNVTGGGPGSSTNVAVGQTIYLDAAFGNDATASRTNATRPFLTVSNAIAAMLSGDTLVVRGGNYPILPKADPVGQPSGAHNVAGVALTNRNNIRIIGEPGAVWAMSAQWSNSCPMMTLYACTNVVIEGMTFRGIRTNLAVLQDFGIMFKYCDTVLFQGNRVQSWQNQGISDISQTTINRNFRILNNDFSDCGGTNQITLGADGTAISINATNLVITGNRFYRNLRDWEICCNADAREVVFANNVSEACYQNSILLIATNVSEATIKNNIAVGYAANADVAGTQWMLITAGSNILVQGNRIGGFSLGVSYVQAPSVRLVDLGIYDNSFNDCTIYPISVHSATAVAANVERISIMRNRFRNATSQAVTLSANHSRIEQNEMADCNTSQSVGGVIRVGFPNGFFTNSTNITIIGNKIYSTALAANASTGIVIYGLSHSNVVWGNEVARNYAATLHDIGVGTLTMPLNKIAPGKLLFSDTNSRMAEVTFGSGMAFDGSTGTLTASGSATQMIAAAIGSLTITNHIRPVGSNVADVGSFALPIRTNYYQAMQMSPNARKNRTLRSDDDGVGTWSPNPAGGNGNLQGGFAPAAGGIQFAQTNGTDGMMLDSTNVFVYDRAAGKLTVNSIGVNTLLITNSATIPVLNVTTLNAANMNLTNALGSNHVRLGYQQLTNILRMATIYADAGCMISNTTDGATFSTEETSSPTNRMYDSYVFSGTITNLVQFKFAMPLNWDLSTVKVKLWTTSTNNIATTTNVWAISASAIKNTSVITNINWGTELTITNTVSTGGLALLTPATPALTIGNTPAAAGNLVWFRIRRLPGHADDNDGGQQRLLGAWIQYGETMSEVASW